MCMLSSSFKVCFEKSLPFLFDVKRRLPNNSTITISQKVFLSKKQQPSVHCNICHIGHWLCLTGRPYVATATFLYEFYLFFTSLLSFFASFPPFFTVLPQVIAFINQSRIYNTGKSQNKRYLAEKNTCDNSLSSFLLTSQGAPYLPRRRRKT